MLKGGHTKGVGVVVQVASVLIVQHSLQEALAQRQEVREGVLLGCAVGRVSWLPGARERGRERQTGREREGERERRWREQEGEGENKRERETERQRDSKWRFVSYVMKHILRM